MLLRRLVDAFRKQDWFTVLIEFLIVVAGIFVGLQVNQWAGEKAERTAERAAIERLFHEAQNAREYLSARASGTKRINQVRRNAVAFIDSDAPLPENELPIKIGINTLAQYPPISVVSVAYEELKTSGQMQLIQSAEIRDVVADFHTGVDAANRLLDGFSDSGDSFFWPAYRRNVTWRYNAEATDTDILLSAYDWEAMRKDRDFITIAIGALRNHVVAEDMLNDLEESAKSMCEALAAALERTCEDDAEAPSPDGAQ